MVAVNRSTVQLMSDFINFFFSEKGSRAVSEVEILRRIVKSGSGTFAHWAAFSAKAPGMSVPAPGPDGPEEYWPDIAKIDKNLLEDELVDPLVNALLDSPWTFRDIPKTSRSTRRMKTPSNVARGFLQSIFGKKYSELTVRQRALLKTIVETYCRYKDHYKK